MPDISPPSDCFQISLSLDKNLMSFLSNETTQLFIMNNLLTTCLGTLSFQFQNRKAEKTAPDHNVLSAVNESTDTVKRKKSVPQKRQKLDCEKLSNDVFYSQTQLEIKAETDEEDEIVCVKEEPVNTTNSYSVTSNPYESSEIIPGLFTKVEDENLQPQFPSRAKLRKSTTEEHGLDLRPVGGFSNDAEQNLHPSTVFLPGYDDNPG